MKCYKKELFNMSNKKYLRKNEFRIDYNREHYGKNEKPHPEYITARYGYKYKANFVTHSRKTSDGKLACDIDENPNKLSTDKKHTRISAPYWQNEKQFNNEKLSNFRFSNKTRKYIIKINKKKK